jgi:integrase
MPGARSPKASIPARRGAAPSFDTVAREWIGRHLASKAEKHRVSVPGQLERDVLPFLGDRPVDEITAPEVLEVVRHIEARGALQTATARFRTSAKCCAMRSRPGARSRT